MSIRNGSKTNELLCQVVLGVVIPFATGIGEQYHFLVVDASCRVEGATTRRPLQSLLLIKINSNWTLTSIYHSKHHHKFSQYSGLILYVLCCSLFKVSIYKTALLCASEFHFDLYTVGPLYLCYLNVYSPLCKIVLYIC